MGRDSDDRIVPATEFKQRCLGLIDQVQQTKRPVVVTKHGRPVVRVVPLEERSRATMVGTVTLIAERPEDYYATGDRWDADRADE